MGFRAFVVSVSVGAAALAASGIGAGIGWAESPAATAVAPKISALTQTLMIDKVMEVMRAEGLKHSVDVSADLLAGQSDDAWRAMIALIYDTEKMTAQFERALAEALGQEAQTIADSTAFFSSVLGQRLLTLEIDARMALLDDATERATKLAWDKLASENPPRVPQIVAFVQANDLVESNVMGALNANLAFYRGLSAAGAFGDPMPEDQMLREVWAQEAEIRTETSDWLYPFLMLSYQPLTDAELQAYIDFSATRSGKALNAAVFVAFDAVMVDLSRALGASAGRLMMGQDI